MAVAFITGGIKCNKVVAVSSATEMSHLIVNNTYRCYYCALSFESDQIRLDHVREAHDPDNLAYSEFGPK